MNCCFIGHRSIPETEELREEISAIIEKLIVEGGVSVFLFGSKSRFNSLCLELVTKMKENYPFIKRIYVRSVYPLIEDWYENYLLRLFDETIFPKRVEGNHKASYVIRNYEMIDMSDFCVFYFNEKLVPKNRKSGTKIALAYAQKKQQVIIKLP